MLIWPWIWLVQSGEFESSKSVMYESAPELKALMTIFASTGPVISTRRHCSAGGTGAIFQSPARIAVGLGEEVGALAGVEPPGALGARARAAPGGAARRRGAAWRRARARAR